MYATNFVYILLAVIHSLLNSRSFFSLHSLCLSRIQFVCFSLPLDICSLFYHWKCFGQSHIRLLISSGIVWVDTKNILRFRVLYSLQFTNNFEISGSQKRITCTFLHTVFEQCDIVIDCTHLLSRCSFTPGKVYCYRICMEFHHDQRHIHTQIDTDTDKHMYALICLVSHVLNAYNLCLGWIFNWNEWAVWEFVVDCVGLVLWTWNIRPTHFSTIALYWSKQKMTIFVSLNFLFIGFSMDRRA